MSAKTGFVLVCIVAGLQAIIAIVEIFFWNRHPVHKRLDFSDAEAKKVAPIVMNAGLYNAFLAAGLVWGLRLGNGGYPILVFFLSCVIIAGLFGAVTLKPTTLALQTLPAALALWAVWKAWPAP